MRMRLPVTILIIWLFLFYNIERMSEPIDITDVAYTFVPFMAVLTILTPRFRKIPLWVLLVVPIPVFLVLKALVKSSAWGTSLTLTVTELCVITVTTLMARWVSNGVSEFEHAVAHITIGQTDTLPEPFSTGQAEMYREIRRARHHQRPLALMAIGVEKTSIQVALDRMVQEVQQAMMKRYVMSDVARRLCDKLEDYDIIAQDNDHFLILLPEVAPEELSDLTNQLHQAISEQAGVTLQIGTASFPKDAVTFESLVDKAVEEMGEEQEPRHSLRPQPLATECPI
jgi:GGDEF domain-containing protein